MQPLYLRIRGFGPFLNAEIPRDTFEIINRERLFLVSGEIGAGKTTLFDAIVYAIFGDTSFPDRSPTDLISQLLPQNSPTPPEVVFEFLLQNRIYRIVRRPKFGAFSSSLSLWVDGKLYSNKEKEVSAKIKDLFGLAGPQFKKVFIIPQGEYRRILLAKPEEKRALFEHLFDTKILSDLQKYFEKTLREKETELRGLFERERELLKLAEVETPEELKERLKRVETRKEELTGELVRISKELRQIEEELRAVETFVRVTEEYERITGELEALEEDRAVVEDLKSRVRLLKVLKEREFHYERAKRLWKEMKRRKEEERVLKAKLSALTEDLSKVEEELRAIQLREEEIEKAKEEIRLLEGLLENLVRRKALQTEVERLRKETSLLEGQFEALGKREEEVLRELEALTDEAQRFRRMEELKAEFGKIMEEISLHEEYLREKKTLSELTNCHLLISEERDRLKGELEKLRDKALAGFLAQKLKKNEPCPVCGSTVHPKRASPSLWQEISLEEWERKLAEKEERLRTIEHEIHRVRGKLELLEPRLRGSKEDLLIRKQELEEALSILKQRAFLFSDISHYENREKELRKLLEEIKGRRESLRGRIEELKRKEASLEGELKGLSSLEMAPYLEPDTLQKKILEIKGEIEAFRRKKEEVLRRYEELERERLQVETALQSHQRYLREIVADYRESFREVLRPVKEGLFSSLKELKVAWEDLKNLSRYEEEISSFEEKQRMLSQRLEILKQELERLKKTRGEEFFQNHSERLQELQKLKDTVESRKEELNRELGRLENTLSQLLLIERNLLDIAQQKKALDEEYSILKHLSEVISGKPRGVSFHSFVLSRFLTLILRRANFYFREFTSGRFAFVEGEIFTRGFILEIFDSYTGQKRELKTLSGGESFLASLAFALGTSDILLRLSQRPPLETILIDEGFGSLDEASLEKVTDTLVSVSQRSGKIIGLISHLREMKERIPVVIEIVKTEGRGSIIQRARRNY